MPKPIAILTAAAVVGTVALGMSAEAAKAPAAPTAEQQKVLSQCAMCHDITGAKKSMMGPPLFGVVGHKPVMSGVPYKKWDKKALDQFLKDPSAVKADTTMPVSVEDAKERAAVIKALEGLK